MKIKTITNIIWPVLLSYLVYLLSKIIWIDNLSSFANDSVHYLVMARHYSPWQSESVAISSAWLLQDFPPLFPMLLAITGAAHSYLFAHILVAALGILSLYFCYLLAIKYLDNRAWVFLPVIVIALSPGFILALQGILSESLYLLLTVLFLLYYQPEEKISKQKLLIISLLLAAILLTRTVGIALCFGILAQATFSSLSKKKIQMNSIYIVAISLFLYFTSMAIWGPVKESHYMDVLTPYLSGLGLYEQATGKVHYFSPLFQLDSMLENWTTFWLIFWTDELAPPYIITTILLAISVIGLVIRLFKNKFDAWYVLFFLLILFTWPHPGQMFRLIFPVMPFLTLYAGYVFLNIPRLNNTKVIQQWIPASFFLILLAAILPTHYLLHTRANAALEKNMIPIYEIFRRANPHLADVEMEVYNQMFSDFKWLENSVAESDKTIYFLPSYLAVLSNRTGINAPSPFTKKNYQKITREKNVKYIFLTRLHPRNSGLHYNTLRDAGKLESWTKIIKCSQLKSGSVSCLFKVAEKNKN